jgi:phosphopantetheine--protein transferase-like protein
MILGIGTDILNANHLAESSLSPSDPFLKKTYTEREIAEAMTYLDAHSYYATRFAGKEAVFKTFGAHPDSIRLDEIEILGDENGAPKVTLHGRARRMAEAMGASHVHISLSYDLPFVIAFAVMEKRDN